MSAPSPDDYADLDRETLEKMHRRRANRLTALTFRRAPVFAVRHAEKAFYAVEVALKCRIRLDQKRRRR